MTYTSKTIFFVISAQHFIPTGGIGSFFRGFLRMALDLGYDLTVVLDKKPIGQGKLLMDPMPGVRLVWPDKPASYAKPPEASRFDKEDINPAKVANFETSLRLALAMAQPQHILINTPDAVQSVTQLGLHQQVPTTFYTHHENLVMPPSKASKVFSPAYNDFLYAIPATLGIRIATQSPYNIVCMDWLTFVDPPIVLPMPIPDPSLMQPYAGPKEGVLFIGRFEPRKDPNRFVETVARAGLPAKVLTNARGAAKFEAAFAKVGMTQVDIRFQIIGQEKADFIRSARVAFHPALSESYGFSAMETLAAGVPTVLLEENGWWRGFENDGIHLTNKAFAVSDITKLYHEPPAPPRTDWAQREQGTFKAWQDYLG